VNRDLGVVVPEQVLAAELQATIKEAGGPLLESVRAFDEYRGGQVPEGHKSAAFALTFRSPERTLTDAEVDAQLEAVRRELRRRHGAGFRE
jgi:phenylalanyl-tRNA synthetase beta chain